MYKMNYLACLIFVRKFRLLSDGTKLRSKKKLVGITPLVILKNFQIRISPINRKQEVHLVFDLVTSVLEVAKTFSDMA